ncbi:hypothetical protein PpBr36_01780 [Pyricularia pennisetigena]|uniref:hypothetical protein n=1 Tax=Pyricularia pennisetigena TaxID=1578925 RepID=UPI001154EA45|nr:hypothetical protein PpBr36_01780 [Pyricularia pennisetigena]TLS27766.1 hypothetical protein PpBr36_01780 [Pyricularia pennisetigena]
MHFSDEEAALLKAWIVKRLENTSDADPDVLADYVLALLRHDGSPEEVRKLCEEEIPDFLKEESTVFLDDVFAAIAYKSFLPGAPPAPKLPQAQAQPPPPLPQIPASAYYAAAPPPAAPAFAAPRDNPSRKRSYRDFDDPNSQPNGEHTYDGGRGKQARRHNGYPSANSGMPGAEAQGSGFNYDPMAMLDSMQAFVAQQQQALAAGGMAPRFQRSGRGQGSKRGRCRDYDAQGYCTRGNTCKFEHGPPTGFDLVPPPAGQFDGYDPTNAALLLPQGNGQEMMPMNLPPLPGFPFNGRQPQFPLDNRQAKGPKGKGGRRSQLSAEGPVHDKSRSTIVVENIPEENFTEEDVRGFFSQFGKIVSVSMQPYKRLAVVEYETWASANAAYRSPKVIFDNRFVRVFWRKEDDDEQLGKPAGTNGNAGGGNIEAAHATNGGKPGTGEEHHAAEPEVDMEEFARRQEEAQKVFEEKKRKRQELDRQRQDLEQQQKELDEERKKLRAKLVARGAGESHNRGSSPDVTFSTDTGSSSKPESEETRALRATLAALEEEARSMGLNPEESGETSSWPPAYRGRGGYRGRGRGGYPFAPHYSTYPPRAGFRGGYRGRGRGNHHAAYAMYSLDHRPKRIAVSGVDFSTADKDEALRQYLLGVGEFKEIQVQDSGAVHISFSDRKTAETFYYGLASGKGIPGIEAPIELAWVPNSAAETAASSSKPSPGQQGPEGRDAADGNDDVMNDGTRDHGSPRDSNGDDDENMDYEAADDEGNWDVA